MSDYVHGYSDRERTRLEDQARTLAELLHHDTAYPAGAHVLELGCGVGAQTLILARRNPKTRFTSVDISPASIRQARAAVKRAGLKNVSLRVADLFALPFARASFDHIFVCFVLEHLPDLEGALRRISGVLRKGGTLTVIEGDHGSTFFHPHSAAAWRTIQCLIDLQSRAGGDALIGRRLFPLLTNAGFKRVTVSPRFVYADASHLEWVRGFTLKTYVAMVEGARERALAAGMISESEWRKGMAELRAAARRDGTFCYTFFKATAVK